MATAPRAPAAPRVSFTPQNPYELTSLVICSLSTPGVSALRNDLAPAGSKYCQPQASPFLFLIPAAMPGCANFAVSGKMLRPLMVARHQLLSEWACAAACTKLWTLACTLAKAAYPEGHLRACLKLHACDV